MPALLTPVKSKLFIVAHRVLRHRVVLGFEAIAENTRVETVVDALVATVRTP